MEFETYHGFVPDFRHDVCQIFHILMHVRLVTNITALCSVPLIPRQISSSTNSGFRGSKWKVILFVRVLISCCLQNQTCYDCTVSSMELFISSVRSSSGYHGLIEIRNPLFQIFQILQIRKWKWKDPTCAIFFEKHWIQGYRIWHSRVWDVKYTNTQLHKYANTQIQSA